MSFHFPWNVICCFVTKDQLFRETILFHYPDNIRSERCSQAKVSVLQNLKQLQMVSPHLQTFPQDSPCTSSFLQDAKSSACLVGEFLRASYDTCVDMLHSFFPCRRFAFRCSLCLEIVHTTYELTPLSRSVQNFLWKCCWTLTTNLFTRKSWTQNAACFPLVAIFVAVLKNHSESNVGDETVNLLFKTVNMS